MSKGSTRRPTQLTQAELAERWAEAFRVGERQQPGGVWLLGETLVVNVGEKAMEALRRAERDGKARREVLSSVPGKPLGRVDVLDVDDEC